MLDSAFPDTPVGGVIVRDDLGEPTAILLNSATTLISDHAPKPSIKTIVHS